MSHKRSIILLAAVTILVFANSLLNGFVGDDNFLILNNDFYTSWNHARDLFSSEYTTHSVGAIGVQDQKQYYSGSVAYRPVLSLTYFLDYSLWQENPFGYHLTNLIWHLLNVFGVYVLFAKVGTSNVLAFLSAMVFSIHPYRSEAVCSIGYRADLVSTFFLLVATIAYIVYRQNSKMKSFHWISHLAFALAVFAKESAIVFPALIWVYDCVHYRLSIRALLKNDHLKRYVGYVVVALFYLFVYLYVFPNRAAASSQWIGENLWVHIKSSLLILAEYMYGFFLPLMVDVLPPVYAPQPELYSMYYFSALMILLLGTLMLFGIVFRRDRLAAFFILWFVLAMIPVSNAIPLVNPMAHRFLYLPSIGMSYVLVQFIIRLGEWMNARTNAQRFVVIFMVGYLGICAIRTFTLNAYWKHDYIMALRMYQSKPEYPTSLLFMGITYAEIEETEKAREMILKGLQRGLRDPRAYYILAQASLTDHEAAKQYLQEGILKYPTYGMLYTGLGRVYLLEQNLDQALSFLQRGVEMAPTYRGFCYLVQTHLLMGNETVARETLERAKPVLTDPKFHEFIQNIIDHRDRITLPQDIGL